MVARGRPSHGPALTTAAPAPVTSHSPPQQTSTTTPPPLPSILDTLPAETMIPSLFVLLAASVTLTLTNALFNLLAQRDRSVGETFRQWSRVLWMSRAAHIVEPPSAAEAHRLTQHRHIVVVSAQTTPMMSPVELYNSAAFFRGIAAPESVQMEDMPHHTTFASHAYGAAEASSTAHRRPGTPSPSAGSRGVEMGVYHAENPPAAVPAPVVAEALTNTMEAVRLESQRLLFQFHPYYIIVCSLKAGAMLLYVQYHFDAIEGGWRRFCVCGAANIFSGLLTPVWEYLNLLLLPLDPERAQPAVVKVDEEKTDSVFIVEVLLRIGSLELDDLPTVLTQGSSFVAFAAVLVPLLLVFCLPGVVRYVWLYVPLWTVYALVRYLYYRGAGALPSPTTRNAAAVVGMTTEMVKAFSMKALTFFVVLVTVQSSFLLGLAWAENASYDAGLRYTADLELAKHRSGTAASRTAFRHICLLSQLFF